MGCVLGGLALGISAGAAGTLAPAWITIAAVIVAALSGAALVHRRSHLLAGRCWQVPKAWWYHLGEVAFIPAGATLTFGFFTPIIFPTFWVLVALLATLTVIEAASIGALYGFLRTVSNWRTSLGRPSLGIGDPYSIAYRRKQAWYVVKASLALSLVAVVSPVLRDVVL